MDAAVLIPVDCEVGYMSTRADWDIVGCVLNFVCIGMDDGVALSCNRHGCSELCWYASRYYTCLPLDLLFHAMYDWPKLLTDKFEWVVVSQSSLLLSRLRDAESIWKHCVWNHHAALGNCPGQGASGMPRICIGTIQWCRVVYDSRSGLVRLLMLMTTKVLRLCLDDPFVPLGSMDFIPLAASTSMSCRELTYLLTVLHKPLPRSFP